MKKAKLFLSLISSAIIASTTVLGASAAHYKGDIDRNDQVTLSDVVSIQKHLSGKSSIDKDKLIYADMNDDSKINVFDLILAKRVVIGDIEKEEVPSLTTPAVTTAAPVTTTTISTTVAETTTVEETTTTTTTKISYEETTTTTTVTKATTTKAGITTAETTIAEETTKATEETTVTEAVETTVATTADEQVTVGTTLKLTVDQSKTISIPIDSEKELDFIEFEFDTSADFGFHAYIDNWISHIDITNTSGTLKESNLKNIETVTIDGNKAKVEFSDNVSGSVLSFVSNRGTIEFTVNIAYVGDTATEPAETTVTSDEIVETTETTVTTVTETTVTTTTSTEETTTVAETEATTVTTTVSDSSDTVQTGVAGTDVNRGALIIYGDKSLVVDKDYYAELTDESGIAVPEITGNGTYTVKFTLSEPNIITWLELRLLSGTSGKALNSLNYSNLDVTIDSFKADGVETTKSLDSVSKDIANWDGASVTIMNLLDSTTVNESIEVTFTVTGIE